MPRLWPEAEILTTLDLAAQRGSATVTCQTPRDAELFRNAIYNYARRHNIPLTFILSVSGCDLILSRPEEPRTLIISAPSTESEAAK